MQIFSGEDIREKNKKSRRKTETFWAWVKEAVNYFLSFPLSNIKNTGKKRENKYILISKYAC